MKKILLSLAVLFTALTAGAQTAIGESKILDNVYVGASAGVNTPLTFNQMFPLNESFGIHIGKNLTPVFGFDITGTMFFGDHVSGHEMFVDNQLMLRQTYKTFGSKTFVKALSAGINGTVNFSNLFYGYKGTPRLFEVSGVVGLASFWELNTERYEYSNDVNELFAKTGVGFALNLGKEKAWTVYAEPSVAWNLTNKGFNNEGSGDGMSFNKKHSYLQLEIGLNYHFKNSNKTRSFVVYDINQMNEEINKLAETNAKLEKKIVETPDTVIKVVNANKSNFTIFFEKNSAELSDLAKQTLNEIPADNAVCIDAYASEEGTSTYNKSLSESRADAVREYLDNRNYKIETVIAHGEKGDIHNRVVVVTIK